MIENKKNQKRSAIFPQWLSSCASLNYFLQTVIKLLFKSHPSPFIQQTLFMSTDCMPLAKRGSAVHQAHVALAFLGLTAWSGLMAFWPLSTQQSQLLKLKQDHVFLKKGWRTIKQQLKRNCHRDSALEQESLCETTRHIAGAAERSTWAIAHASDLCPEEGLRWAYHVPCGQRMSCDLGSL